MSSKAQSVRALAAALVAGLGVPVAIAGPDCFDANNECFAQSQACASVKLCPEGSGSDCTDGLVRSYCLGNFDDTPGNIFDTNGAWGSTKFTYLWFDVQPSDAAGTSYVSLFAADYCGGWPVYFSSGDSGSYLPGEYTFDATEVKCIHPYYWADRPTKPGVGIKLTLWPDNDYQPYDQLTCMGDDWVDAGMSGWFGQGCASGDDGIYCIEPDSWGANDGFLDRLDFAGSTSSSGNDVIKSYQDYGSYPVGSLVINTFFSVAGDHGYCDQTESYSSDGFCSDSSPYQDYCAVTRFSNVAGNSDWDTYDAQASADWQSLCSGWGGMFHSLDMLTTPDGSTYNDWPLPIKYAWTRIVPCGDAGRRLSASTSNQTAATAASSLRGAVASR